MINQVIKQVLNPGLGLSKADLQRITQKAVTEARQATDARVISIVEHAFKQLKIEVAAGRNFAVVMSLRLGHDITKLPGSDKAKVDGLALTGVAAKVWQALAVFEPTLEYWSREEGDQRDSYTAEGYNIVLHWTDSVELLARVQRLGNKILAADLERIIVDAENAVNDKASAILSQLKNRAHQQATAGKTWAIVMSLRCGEDYTPSPGNNKRLSLEQMKPVARTVWESCADFNPTLEYWSREDGDQRDSWMVEGFNIVIHW